MTQRESRPYHHGNLAAALVDAGLAMAAEGGPDAVVLREVARRVGVSPTAAYRHFEGQAGLTEAVKKASLGRLTEHMRAALADHDSAPDGAGRRSPGASAGRLALPAIEPGSPQEHAIRRLEAIGRAYVDFALTDPGLFRCFCIGLPLPAATDEAGIPGMAAGGSTAHASASDLLDGEAAFGVLTAVLDELVATGVLQSERRAATVDIALWSAVHGFAVLCLDGPLAELPRPAQENLLTDVMEVIFHGVVGVPTPHPAAATS